MKISYGCAFNWIVVMCATQRDHPFLARVYIHHHALVTWRYDLIVFSKEKNRGLCNRLCISDAVEIGWNLGGDRTCQEPKIPPPEMLKNDLAECRRIMQNEPSYGSIRSHVQSCRCPETRRKNYNRFAVRFSLQCFERRHRGWTDALQFRWTGAATEPGIIHSPNFNRPLIPGICFGSDPSLRAIGVSVESKHINFWCAALLRAL